MFKIIFFILTINSLRIPFCQYDDYMTAKLINENAKDEFLFYENSDGKTFKNDSLGIMLSEYDFSDFNVNDLKDSLNLYDIFNIDYDFSNIISCYYTHFYNEKDEKLYKIVYTQKKIEKNLYQMIQEKDKIVNQYFWKFDLMYKIMKIVLKMHEKKFLHLNLNPKVILMRTDFVPTITDFVVSRPINSEISIPPKDSRPYYPKSFLELKINRPKIDFYALALIFDEIINGRIIKDKEYDPASNPSKDKFFLIYKEMLKEMTNTTPKTKQKNEVKEKYQLKDFVNMMLNTLNEVEDLIKEWNKEHDENNQMMDLKSYHEFDRLDYNKLRKIDCVSIGFDSFKKTRQFRYMVYSDFSNTYNYYLKKSSMSILKNMNQFI